MSSNLHASVSKGHLHLNVSEQPLQRGGGVQMAIPGGLKGT
jgi:hypothetical protein